MTKKSIWQFLLEKLQKSVIDYQHSCRLIIRRSSCSSNVLQIIWGIIWKYCRVSVWVFHSSFKAWFFHAIPWLLTFPKLELTSKQRHHAV